MAIGAGVIALIAGLNIPFSGLTLIGVAAIVGGIVVIGFAQAMPAVTMSGAMVRAMMAAYRRTLQKTMAQARSMDQVVAEAGLDWLDTPHQAVVWGTALGLQSEIEGVLSRSLEDVQQGRATGAVPYFPDLVPELEWGVAHGLRSGHGERRQPLLGLGIPDIGGMMSTLGTIGNSPSSSAAGAAGSAVARRVAVAAGPVAASRLGQARSADAAPNMWRIRPTLRSRGVGRGRARQLSAVIRNFWVTRGTPSGAKLPSPFSS